MDGDGNFRVGSVEGYGIRWDTSTLRVSSSEFYFGDSSNFISGSNGAINIGANTFGLGTATMIISSSVNSGTIRMGSNGGPISVTADTQGIYMDGTGKFQIFGDSSNYMRFNGGTVDIKTDEITIETAGTNKLKLLADGTNTPTFAMGATLNTSVAGTNKVVFMNGEGDFLLYGSSTNYFKFDASELPTGFYIYHLRTSSGIHFTNKMMLIK